MFLSRIFSPARRVRKLRKRWDREREKALKLKEPLRSSVLKRLDQIELNIRTLEEQKLRREEMARIAKEVEIDLEETKAAMEAEPAMQEQQN